MAMAMTGAGAGADVIESSRVLRLRGLPFEAKENDVRSFFDGFKLLHVHLCRRNGKTTGEAYVQLDSDEEGERARLQLDRQAMGRRYIEIFPAKEVELKKRRAWESQVTGYIVRMRGLPFNASHQDVQNFFMGIQLSQNRDSILLTYNVNKRPSGEAFVEFPTEEARNEALKRDRKMIGHRYIELFPANKADVDKALSQNRYNLRQGHRFQGGFLGGQGLSGQLNNMFLQNQNMGQNLDIADVLRDLSLGGTDSSPNGGYGRVRGSVYPGGGGFQNNMSPFVMSPLSSQNAKIRPHTPYGTTMMTATANAAGIAARPWPPAEGMLQQLPAGFVTSQQQINQELFPNPNIECLDPNGSLGVGDGMQPHLQPPQQQQQQALLQQYMLEQQQQQQQPQQGMQPIQAVPMGLRPALYDPWAPPLADSGLGGGRNFPIFNNMPHAYVEDMGDNGVYFSSDYATESEHPATHAIPQYLGPGDAPPGMITPEEAAQY
eukprot:TRINITY_DN7089_c0_g1_i1.p1 TRINITY_DN7089_c0_g1~~TRINITY_DN7089_c0_g1_i1.p1  ORF type:complete len:490 (-),score=61.09 TRINITY_DN7089_c0_g1_i1:1865-3334(-)